MNGGHSHPLALLAGAIGLAAVLVVAGVTLYRQRPDVAHSMRVSDDLWIVKPQRRRELLIAFTPLSDAPRARVTVNQEAVSLLAGFAQLSGMRLLLLPALPAGYHVLDVALRWRGRSDEHITMGLVAGEFAASIDGSRCAAQLQLAAHPLEDLLADVISNRALTAARATDHFSSTKTAVRRTSVRLRRGGFDFTVDLADDRNHLAISGRIDLAPEGRNRLRARLQNLGEVQFNGSTRKDAETTGAGLGAGVGAVVLGPVGLLGGLLLGASAASNTVSRRARAEVRSGLLEALRVFSATELFPADVLLLKSEVRSQISLSFCGDFALSSDGAVARLSITPPEVAPPAHWALPGFLALNHGLPHPNTRPSSDLTVDLTIDSLNVILDAWTRNGLLSELLGVNALQEQANEALSEYTNLEISGITPRMPPLIVPQEGSEQLAASFAVGLGALNLTLVDKGTKHAREVIAGAQGRVDIRYDARSDGIILGGKIARLHLVCKERAAGSATAVTSCFSSALDLDGFADQWTDSLQPDVNGVPPLRVQELVRSYTEKMRPGGVRLEDLDLYAPTDHPGVMRLQGGIR